MPLVDRVSKFLNEKGLTQSQFCKKTGFSKQNLSKFLTGSVKHVKIDLAMVIAKHFPEVNLRWLLLGEGEMFSENSPSINSTILEENALLRKELINAKDKIITLLEER